MASTGSITKSFTSWDSLRFTWTIASQSVADNKSTVNWQLDLISTGSGRIDSSTEKICLITVNGITYRKDNYINIGNNETKTIASGSTVIAHNADGTKNFSFSFEQQIGITFSGAAIGNVTGSGTGELNRIARASTISCPNGVIGKSVAITINSNSSSFKHNIEYIIRSNPNRTGNIANNTTNTRVVWNIPESLYTSAFVNTASLYCRINCHTYDSGGNFVGTNYIDIIVSVDEATNKPTIAPTIQESLQDIAALCANKPDTFIRYKSIVQYSIGAQAKNGATIKSYKVTNGSQSATAASGSLSYIDSDTFVFSVTDSRGFTTTESITINLIPYVKPTCHIEVSAPTTEGRVNITISGYAYRGTFPNGTANTVNLYYFTKVNNGEYGEGALFDQIAPNEDNTYSISKDLEGFDYQNTYTFYAQCWDAAPSSLVESTEKRVKTLPVFDWGENDFNFNVPVSINGVPIADYVIEEGNDNLYAYRKWNSGILEAWRMTNNSVTIATSSQYGGVYYADGLSLTVSGGAAQFKSVENIQLSINKNGTAGFWNPIIAKVTVNNDGTVTINYLLTNPTSGQATLVPKVYMIGRWK